jgi:hypothetical protein
MKGFSFCTQVICFSFCLMAVLPSVTQAQQVVFQEEPDIRSMINRYVQSNRSPDRLIDVWKIQISATVDRRQMEQAKSVFRQRYPGYALNATYAEPYYKLQVGAYFEKRKAQAVAYKLKQYYPGAYLTRDKVKLSELTD